MLKSRWWKEKCVDWNACACDCKDDNRNTSSGLRGVCLAPIVHWLQLEMPLCSTSFALLFAFMCGGCHCSMCLKGISREWEAFQGNGKHLGSHWNTSAFESRRARQKGKTCDSTESMESMLHAEKLCYSFKYWSAHTKYVLACTLMLRLHVWLYKA